MRGANEPPGRFPGAGFRGNPGAPVDQGDAGDGAGGNGSFVNGGGFELSVGVRARCVAEPGTVSRGTDRRLEGVEGSGPRGGGPDGARLLLACARGVGVVADRAESSRCI